jgi:hypothetical protein
MDNYNDSNDNSSTEEGHERKNEDDEESNEYEEEKLEFIMDEIDIITDKKWVESHANHITYDYLEYSASELDRISDSLPVRNPNLLRIIQAQVYSKMCEAYEYALKYKCNSQRSVLEHIIQNRVWVLITCACIPKMFRHVIYASEKAIADWTKPHYITSTKIAAACLDTIPLVGPLEQMIDDVATWRMLWEEEKSKEGLKVQYAMRIVNPLEKKEETREEKVFRQYFRKEQNFVKVVRNWLERAHFSGTPILTLPRVDPMNSFAT